MKNYKIIEIFKIMKYYTDNPKIQSWYPQF